MTPEIKEAYGAYITANKALWSKFRSVCNQPPYYEKHPLLDHHSALTVARDNARSRFYRLVEDWMEQHVS